MDVSIDIIEILKRRIGTPGMVETDKEILDVMMQCANLPKSQKVTRVKPLG